MSKKAKIAKQRKRIKALEAEMAEMRERIRLLERGLRIVPPPIVIPPYKGPDSDKLWRTPFWVRDTGDPLPDPGYTVTCYRPGDMKPFCVVSR